jgi:hypothetical protein
MPGRSRAPLGRSSVPLGGRCAEEVVASSCYWQGWRDLARLCGLRRRGQDRPLDAAHRRRAVAHRATDALTPPTGSFAIVRHGTTNGVDGKKWMKDLIDSNH